MYTVEELAQVRNIDNSSLSGAGKAEYRAQVQVGGEMIFWAFLDILLLLFSQRTRR